MAVKADVRSEGKVRYRANLIRDAAALNDEVLKDGRHLADDWVDYWTTGDSKNELAKHYLSSVRGVAKSVEKSLANKEVKFIELLSCGTIGLMQALAEYDPREAIKKRTKFSTYAHPRVKGAILDELNNSHHLPPYIRGKERLVNRARFRLLAQNGVEPSAESLETELDKDEYVFNGSQGSSKARSIMHGSTDLPELSHIYSKDDDGEVSMMPLGSRKLTSSVSEWDGDLLWKVLDMLPSQDRELIDLHYFGNRQFIEIGELMGCSGSNIGSRKKKIINWMKAELDDMDDDLGLEDVKQVRLPRWNASGPIPS